MDSIDGEKLNLAFTIGLASVASMVTLACGFIVARKIILKRFDATFTFSIGLFLWALGTWASYWLGSQFRYCRYLGEMDCSGILSSPLVPWFVGVVIIGGLWHIRNLTWIYNEKIWMLAALLTTVVIIATYWFV